LRDWVAGKKKCLGREYLSGIATDGGQLVDERS